MDLQSTKPFIGQKGIFYGSQIADYEPEGVPCVVCKVWSDTCVNLELNNGSTPTSVLVLTPGGLKPSGYWCELEAPQTMVQPKVTGYRQLSHEEVALMNEAKALAEQCGAFIAKLRAMNEPNRDRFASPPQLDLRWVALGATDLQRGFMAVIRGIAQPTTF